MKRDVLPSFSQLYQCLRITSNPWHPSEMHGYVTGIICGDLLSQKTSEEVLSVFNLSKKKELLPQRLFESSRKLLAELSLNFLLILPSDRHALKIRMLALTLWCQGFLTGLNQFKISFDHKNKSSEINDALKDLTAITEADYENIENHNDNENNYTELLEYVRVTVILIYEELREKPVKTKPISNLH